MIPTIIYADSKLNPVQISPTQPALPTRKRRTLESQGESTSKRLKSTFDPTQDKPDLNKIDPENLQSLAKYFTKTLSLKDFELLGDILESIRKIVSISDNPPMKELIATGICPSLSKLLDDTYCSHSKLQVEASWIFTNMTSGTSENTVYAVELGIIPKLKRMILSLDDEVSCQAIWGLSNISVDKEYQDQLLKLGVIGALLERIDGKELKIPHIRNIAWLISNLCRGKPYPAFKKVKQSLLILKEFLKIDDDELLTNTLWALSYLSEGQNHRIQAIIDCNIVKGIVKCMGRDNLIVVTPCIRTVGNLLTGDDLQTSTILEAGVLDYMSNLLISTKNYIRKEACWMMSNILAGNSVHIQAVIDKKEIIDKLFQVAYTDNDSMKYDALISLTNCTWGATKEQIKVLVESEFIEFYKTALENALDAKWILKCLEGLENIMQNGSDYVKRVKDCGCKENVDKLLTHPSAEVYNTASSIIQAYFVSDEQFTE